MEKRIFDEIADEIHAGQKAALEAIQESLDGKSAIFLIGAISALEGQVKAIKNHLMGSVGDPITSMLLLKMAKKIYKKTVFTEIISCDKKVEDKN